MNVILDRNPVSISIPDAQKSVFFLDFSCTGKAKMPNDDPKWREAPQICFFFFPRCVKWLKCGWIFQEMGKKTENIHIFWFVGQKFLELEAAFFPNYQDGLFVSPSRLEGCWIWPEYLGEKKWGQDLFSACKIRGSGFFFDPKISWLGHWSVNNLFSTIFNYI